MDIRKIERALDGTGLIIRGGFAPQAGDGLKSDVACVVMIGNAGPEMWDAFSESSEFSAHVDPLDAWSRRVIGDAASRLQADAVYPFDGPPYFPFQRWAMRADQVWASPIGPLVHPEFGLWHAYRGALLFRVGVAFESRSETASPCDTCIDQPCLTTCPVAAFPPGGYDVPACAGYLKSAAGEDCMSRGCLARRACPVGREYHYGTDHAGFHMFHFLKNHR